MNSTAITSTGTRMTQNLSAPPTQNTAPVHEFRCLYTSDLRRKQKRWQDGFLRFHTFNKRIMVYEAPSRNYVGDKHWREDEDIQDGDEIQLERPVLVQVGEQIGSTETDLTELLEKRRKPQDKVAETGVSSPRRHIGSGVSAVGPPTLQQHGQPSQLRPKTLNALLGTPTRPTGRASLPTKSPHELRHEKENAHRIFDRPAKRRRIDVQREDMPNPTSRPRIRTMVAEEPCVERHKSVAALDSAASLPREAQILLPANETTRKSEPPSESLLGRNEADKAGVNSETICTAPTSKQAKSSELKRIDEPVKRRGAKGQLTSSGKAKERLPRRTTDELTNTESITSGHSDTTGNRSTVGAEPIWITSDEEAASIGKPPEVKMKLQIASRKPRKKLMYRDLLPRERLPARFPSADDVDLVSARRERTTSSKPSNAVLDNLSNFHQEEQNCLADLVNKCNRRTSQSNDDPDYIFGPRARSPGLFVSEEDLVPLSARHRTANGRFSECLAPRTGERRMNNRCSKSKLQQSQESTESTIPKAASTITDTALTLSKMDAVLFPHSRSCQSIDSSNPPHITQSLPSVYISSPLPIPLTPRKRMFGPTPQKGSPPITLIPSSPGFQTPFNNSPKQSASEEKSGPRRTLSRSRSPSPKLPSLQAQCSQSPPPEDAHSVRQQILPKMSLVTGSVVHLHKAPSPEPYPPNRPPAKALPSKLQPPPRAPSLKPTSPKVPSSKPPPAATVSPSIRSPDPPLASPSHKPTPQQNTTTSPPFPQPTDHPVPEFDLRIAQKPLPAFQAPRAKPKARSPLKKSTSDTTSMRPSPDLSHSLPTDHKPGASRAVTNDGTATPWSKEAWDLFGCGKDGVQCSYEEFKRKEGLD